MRHVVLLVLFLSFYHAELSSQQEVSIKEISRYWTDVNQEIGIENDSTRKFALKGQFKIESDDPAAGIILYFLKYNKDENESPEYQDVKKFNQGWEKIMVSGTLSNDTRSLEIGAYCQNNGKFYFDYFELLVENDKGEMEPFSIANSTFDKPITGVGTIPDWGQGESDGIPIRVKEFTIDTFFDEEINAQVLRLVGSGIDSTPEKIGGEGVKGSTIEIEGMISMLEDLKNRVERQVNELSQYEIDHLHDEKANRIGALIMHLAAAEAFYQVFTFEARGFNEEEKEKWDIALNLGEKAREVYQGKDIQHYLDIYNKVRAKTIEELRKRDDAWFKEIQRVYNYSNQYCWFHVMEHQSSHLGQILFLRKRIPPENKIEIQESLKD